MQNDFAENVMNTKEVMRQKNVRWLKCWLTGMNNYIIRMSETNEQNSQKNSLHWIIEYIKILDKDLLEKG